MKGVLVIGHGSRAKGTDDALKEIVEIAAGKTTGVCVEYAFMQLSERTIESGVAALAEKGVTEIKIVPYFLFMGVHMKDDIPEIVAECAKKYPEIKVSVAEHIGTDKQRLAEILTDKIR